MKFAVILSIIACIGLVGALVKSRIDVQPRPQAPPLAQPAGSPFLRGGVAGTGLVEPASELVSVAPPVAGVVREVRASVGLLVAPGDELYRLDDRNLQAERAVRAAALAGTEARLARLAALPRPETLPALAARLSESDALLADAQAAARRADELLPIQGISADEAERRRHAVAAALARREAAAAALAEARAGSWEPDLAVARAEVASSRAALAAIETELARLVVRSPLAASVLRVDLRAGEWAQPGSTAVVLGDVSELRVRASLDEADLPRLDPQASAKAVVRGGGAQVPLTLVRREPLMLAKRNLSGDAAERVDTRVVQLLYRCDTAAAQAAGLLPGQLVDVYLESSRE